MKIAVHCGRLSLDRMQTAPSVMDSGLRGNNGEGDGSCNRNKDAPPPSRAAIGRVDPAFRVMGFGFASTHPTIPRVSAMGVAGAGKAPLMLNF
jgi:hypothetical protein